jgi:hypothetical protein
MATKTSAKKTGGILGGIALFVVGIFILWNNEGRTVKEQNAINEALKGYTDVSSEKIDSKYEGKIIATTGKIDLSNSSEVRDSKFGISEIMQSFIKSFTTSTSLFPKAFLLT